MAAGKSGNITEARLEKSAIRVFIGAIKALQQIQNTQGLRAKTI